MQSVKVEPRCVTIVSSASSTLGAADAVVDSSGGAVGRWRRRGSLSCNGDLCPVVISSPYCKRSNTTTALCSVVSTHDYDINEKFQPTNAVSSPTHSSATNLIGNLNSVKPVSSLDRYTGNSKEHRNSPCEVTLSPTLLPLTHQSGGPRLH